MLRRALPLLAVVPAAACGGSSISLDPVARAATKTADVASARFQIDMAFTDPDTRKPLHGSGPGVIADHGHLIEMKLHLDKTKDTPAFTMDGILTDDAMYLRSRFFRIGMPPGKEWLKARDEDPVGNIGQNDPSQMLDYLRGAGSVDAVGSENIRGVKTTKYRARIDLDQVVEKVPEQRRDRVRHAIDFLHKIGVKEIPVTAWVGDDGLVRRERVNWTIQNPQNPSDRFHLEVALDLFDFGTNAHVAVPPAAKTVSYSQFLEHAAGG